MQEKEDVIRRQAAIDAAKKLLDYYGTNDMSKEFADHTAERFMNRVPSAQPERKTGKWHSRFYSQIEMMVCSECQNEFSYDAETGVRDYNFCPNCGCKMER